MALVHANSLSETIDAVNEALFFNRSISRPQRLAAARSIAERTISAGARHVTAEEACRVLRLLDVRDASVGKALNNAAARLERCVGPVGRRQPRPNRQDWLSPYGGGTYCCGRCSISFWRHVAAGGFDDHERRLAVGLKCLKACRKGDGNTRGRDFRGWRVFPTWYTLCALIEMPPELARAELRYAAPLCERTLRRPAREEKYASRRREIARRVLARV